MGIRIVGAALIAAGSMVAVGGLASAGQGGPYDNAIDILYVDPAPAIAGKPAYIFIQERNDTGRFEPFVLTGPCIDTYTFDPASYKLPFAYKGSFGPTLTIKPGFTGECTLFVKETTTGLSDSFTFKVFAGKVTDPGSDTTSTSTTIKKKKQNDTVLPSDTTVQTNTTKKKKVVETDGLDKDGDEFDSSLQTVRNEQLPSQQAAVAIDSASVIVSPNASTNVAGVSVTNSAASTSVETLPRTGSSAVTQAWLGAALAMIGGAFVFFARRKVRHAMVRSRYLD